MSNACFTNLLAYLNWESLLKEAGGILMATNYAKTLCDNDFKATF